MNEWERRMKEEMLLKGFTREWAEHCAKFAGSLYLKKFSEVKEMLDTLCIVTGIYE